MIKLSKAQQKVMDNLNRDCNAIAKYATFEEFYDNSYCEQGYLPTGATECHITSEQLKAEHPDWFEGYKKKFEACKNEKILLAYAKTETIEKLEKLGLIKIIKTASCNCGFELVKVL